MVAGFVPRCVATASFGLVGTRLLPTSSGSPPAGHLPPQRNLLFYSEGKYLWEQMMFLSC